MARVKGKKKGKGEYKTKGRGEAKGRDGGRGKEHGKMVSSSSREMKQSYRKRGRSKGTDARLKTSYNYKGDSNSSRILMKRGDDANKRKDKKVEG
ncbi:MAG: hypothetical protein QXM95_03050, partial [Candidatus Nitrosocaldus sp.]